jgi:hypothetical protein
MKRIITLLMTVLLAAPIFVMPKPAFAGQVILNPRVLGDTWVNSGATMITRGADTQLTYGYYASGVIHNIYLKFDVPTIPSNATIDSAYLKLYVQSCSGSPNPTTFTLAQVMGDWAENTLTWANKPSQVGAVQTSANSSCPSGYFNYSVTSIVNEWKNGDPNYGIVLYGLKNSEYYRNYWSREMGASYEPLLTIRYTVPDPAPGNTNTSPSGNTGITNTNSATSTTNTSTAPVDATVVAPSFIKVVESGGERTATNGEVEVNGPLTTIIGSATPGNKVLVMVNGANYETTANSLGYWGVTVDTKSWKDGKYEVKAQAINSAGEGSNIVSLVTLNKVDLVALAKELSAGARGLNWLDKLGVALFWLGPLFSILFWVLVIFLIIFFVKRHKKKKAEKEAAKTTENPAAQVEPVEEPKGEEKKPKPKPKE